MGNGVENKREKCRWKICIYVTGLMGILTLFFVVAFYRDYRSECLKSAYEAADGSAERLAAGLDGYLAASGDTGLKEWEQWLAGYAGSGKKFVVMDGQGNAVFSTDDDLEQAALELLRKEKAGEHLEQYRGGGNDAYVAALGESRLSEYSFAVFCDPFRSGEGVRVRIFWLLGLVLAEGIAYTAMVCGLCRPAQRLEENNCLLQDSMLQMQSELQKIFELRLIRGEAIHGEECDAFVKNALSGGLYAVMVVVLDLKDEQRQEEIDESAVCERILTEMSEELRRLACLPPVCGRCSVVAVFSGGDEEALAGQVREYYEGLSKTAAAVCGRRILAGVSAWQRDPACFYKAYRESVDAIVNSEEKKRSGMFAPNLPGCFFLQPGLEFSNTFYDDTYEERLKTGVRNMEREQCCSAVEDFVRYLAQEGYSYDRLTLYLLRFINALLLAAQQVNVDLESLYPDGLYRVYEELLEVPEPHRVKRYMINRLIDPILEVRGRLLERKSYSMLEDIEHLIRARRGNLSLQECAEFLGVHPTYIWKLIKAENGKTFSDFLEKYKLEEAKRLLVETNMTVSEIAVEMNYTNAQNFIRFFSKSTGTTPGQYRKQKREEKL